ncbi:MAG: hypothetical protein HC765_14900 [Brachymonas sp.]|nr:hypothetical protein [Brachymonas sp.]
MHTHAKPRLRRHVWLIMQAMTLATSAAWAQTQSPTPSPASSSTSTALTLLGIEPGQAVTSEQNLMLELPESLRLASGQFAVMVAQRM